MLTLSGVGLLPGCRKPVDPDAVVIPHHPLQPAYVPAGTVSKAADGVFLGEPKIRCAQTNGQLCTQEIHLKSKEAGPPPHVHAELDEIMYVAAGTVHVLVGEMVQEVHAGDWHVRPHGLVHTFWNASTAPAHFLDLYPNQDFLSYFDEAVRIEMYRKSQELAPDSAEVTKRLAALNARFGIIMYYDRLPAIIKKYGLISTSWS